VRQLENICHWLTVMAPAQVIEPKDLPPEVLAMRGGARSRCPMRAPTHLPRAGALGGRGPAAGRRRPHRRRRACGRRLPAGCRSADGAWEHGLELEANELLASGRHDVWDELTRRFESKLILAALASTRGRRIEAAQKLGIGRNTITRKIQELGLE
jgi:two-component system nitrogen regulation response regulator GlnG